MNENTKKTKNIILFGAGENCEIVLELLEVVQLKGNVKYIVDNNTELEGDFLQGVEILQATPEKCITAEDDVIFVTSDYYYEEIKKQLVGYGLKEEINFFNARDYLPLYVFKEASKVIGMNVAFYVTTKCSLRCKYCTQKSPYIKEKKHFLVEDVLLDMKGYFETVDFTHEIMLVGGEPLLHPDFGLLIEELQKNYGTQFSEITIITNGTIMPSLELLEIMANKNIHFEISDYGETVNKKRIEDLTKILNQYNISYDIIAHGSWTNMWRDENENCGLINRFKFIYCNNKCRSVYKGKFFLCAQPVAEMFMDEDIRFDENDFVQ